ncbi:MAG: hypothetical protein WCF22_10130 [Candidatus Sulfotelmatobacter sp.]
MNKYDWELLNKQIPPQNNGVMGLIAVVTFCVGIALGTLFTHQSEPMRTVSNYTSATVFLQNDALVGRNMHYYR